MAGLHELKPATARDWPSALVFAVRLAMRRLQGRHLARTTEDEGDPLLLWATTSAIAAEHGRLHAPGLAALGLPPRNLIVVEAARETDLLWALEEGVRSRAPHLVVGVMNEVTLTPSRRLALAAAESGVPCLVVTAPRQGPAPAAQTRWRIARAPSAPHPFDPEAPGAARVCLTLERCRGASAQLGSKSFTVEWCDVAHRFHLVAGMADRSVAADEAWPRARSPSLRAG